MLSSARGAFVVDLPFSEFSTSIEFADACRVIRKRRRRIFGASLVFLSSESVFSMGSGKSEEEEIKFRMRSEACHIASSRIIPSSGSSVVTRNNPIELVADDRRDGGT